MDLDGWQIADSRPIASMIGIVFVMLYYYILIINFCCQIIFIVMTSDR